MAKWIFGDSDEFIHRQMGHTSIWEGWPTNVVDDPGLVLTYEELTELLK